MFLRLETFTVWQNRVEKILEIRIYIREQFQSILQCVIDKNRTIFWKLNNTECKLCEFFCLIQALKRFRFSFIFIVLSLLEDKHWQDADDLDTYLLRINVKSLQNNFAAAAYTQSLNWCNAQNVKLLLVGRASCKSHFGFWKIFSDEKNAINAVYDVLKEQEPILIRKLVWKEVKLQEAIEISLLVSFY